jgi:hypothetical protein
MLSKFYKAIRQARLMRENGTFANEADGINDDGSRNVKLMGSNVKLLDAVSATGVGTLKPSVGSFKTYVFEVWGSASSFTLQIEAVGASGTPRVINKVWDELNNGYLSGKDITVAGFYSVSVPSFTTIQANVTAIASGNVNVSGGLMS